MTKNDWKTLATVDLGEPVESPIMSFHLENTEFFTNFRITQTGPNKFGSDAFQLGAIEFFGTVYKK